MTLEPGKQPGHDTVQTPALPGVTAYIMGPSRDEAVIRDMDPPEGGGYLRLAASAGDSADGAPEPFREDWWLAPDEFDAGHLVVSPADRKAIAGVGSDTEQAVAAGADEIDMVIDRGAFLSGRYGEVFDEIVAVKEACGGAHLKVILETGELHTLDRFDRP